MRAGAWWILCNRLIRGRIRFNSLRPEWTSIMTKPKTKQGNCRHHGLTEYVFETRGYYRCRQCRTDRSLRRRQNCKRLLVEAFGGCCQLCGYRRCLRALEVHHLDGTTKEFTISQWRNTTSWRKITQEVLGCVLVCSNCHPELEEGLVRIP